MFEGLTPAVAGTASVALLTLIFAAMWKLLAILRKNSEQCERTVSDLRADCQWKDQQKADLITALQKASLPVPRIAFQDRPSERDRDREHDKDDDK